MDKSLCVGCIEYRVEKGGFLKCPIKASGRANECPCVICPVKVMCHASCEAYRKLRLETNDKY